MNKDLHGQDHSCSMTIQPDFHRLCLTWPLQFYTMDLKVGVAVSHRCSLAHSGHIQLNIVVSQSICILSILFAVSCIQCILQLIWHSVQYIDLVLIEVPLYILHQHSYMYLSAQLSNQRLLQILLQVLVVSFFQKFQGWSVLFCCFFPSHL